MKHFNPSEKKDFCATQFISKVAEETYEACELLEADFNYVEEHS